MGDIERAYFSIMVYVDIYGITGRRGYGDAEYCHTPNPCTATAAIQFSCIIATYKICITRNRIGYTCYIRTGESCRIAASYNASTITCTYYSCCVWAAYGATYDMAIFITPPLLFCAAIAAVLAFT